MANIVTIIGASGTGIVSQVPVTSTQTYSFATSAVANISALISGGGTYGQVNVSGGYSGTTPIVGSVGNFGTPSTTIVANVGTLPTSVQALVVNNLGTTTAANSQFSGGETVLSGTGNLNFTDNGFGTTIITGGGTNNVTFSSKSAYGTFYGDGSNTVTVNASAGAATIYGTTASADTIIGTAGSKLAYSAVAGSSAIIDPNGANVTVFGGSGGGAVSVFGAGAGGSLNVTSGTGYFAAGNGGGSVMSSGTLGSTTLIGGGNGDVLLSNGSADVLVAGSGTETLNALNSPGLVALHASTSGNTFMYGSYASTDTFYTSTSTANYVVNGETLFEGSFVAMHTLPNGVLRAANNVSDTLAVGFSDPTSTANYAAVYDFVSGSDTVLLNTVGTGANYTLSYGTTNGLSSTTLTTTNGSTILFYNAHVVASDISKVGLV